MAVIELNTEPTMRKHAEDGDINPWWIGGSTLPKVKLRKLARIRGFLGQPFHRALNNARKKIDPNLEPVKSGERSWGRKRPDASVVEHEGSFSSPYYLDFRAETVLAVEYARAGNLHRIDEQRVRKFLPAREEQLIHWKNPNFANVREIRMNGCVYVLH